MLCRFVLLALAIGCSEARPEPPDEEVPEPPVERCGLDLQLSALEDQPLVAALACESGVPLPDAISFKDLPQGVEWHHESAELRWQPALDQAGDHTIAVHLPGRERGQIRISVADRFEHPENQPIVDPEHYTHEYGLPVFHVTVGPDLNGNSQSPATIVYRGHTYNGAGAKYRGSTSSSYPKRSFTFKFDKDAPFSDEERGFEDVRRLVLTTNFDDNSGLRQRLSFELWNRLDPEHIPIRSFNAVVYVDGQYQGLYQVTDHVDDDLLRYVGLPREVNLYKARTHAANFWRYDDKGNLKKTLNAGYTKEAGLPEGGTEGAYADLEALVAWLADVQPEEFAREWESRLHRRDFEDWLVFTNLIAAGDTTNKNCYLIHDPRPDAPDARWRFIPWDFNTSWGQGYYTQRLVPDKLELDGSAKRNAFFEHLLTDPALRERVVERYREVLRGPWTMDEILSTLDGWAAEIEPAALRDEVKWSEQFRSYWAKRNGFNNHVEEIQYLRDWIRARWQYLGEHL
ncbi:MAG TPA: CotH kinase family protein [Polyangiales bacterium]|nr:CotH kinase family protein [Polyangiales bacterium]